MIDSELENLTAAEAVDAGLIDALKRGEVRINGTYEVYKDGTLDFDQNNVTFRDKNNKLRVCRFKDDYELLKFVELCE